MQSLGAHNHYPVYDWAQDVIVTHTALGKDKETKTAVLVLIPGKHYFVKVNAHPESRITPEFTNKHFYGRWNYIKKYNVFIHVDEIYKDIYLYKLSRNEKDSVPPQVTFDLPEISESRAIRINHFFAADAHRWSLKYAVTSSPIPPSIDSDLWRESTPETYFVRENTERITVYAYAMDMFGNVSKAKMDSVRMEGDKISPVLDKFDVPKTADTLKVIISEIDAHDDQGRIKYLVTESPGIPGYDHPGWKETPPKEYTAGGGGKVTLYAWAMDDNYNISSPKSCRIQINLKEHQKGALRVGPYRFYNSLEDAINRANKRGVANQRIEVDAGTYYSETSRMPYIEVDNLTIVGVSGNLGMRPHIYPEKGHIESRNAFISNLPNGKNSGLTLRWLEISGVNGKSANSPAVRMHNTKANSKLIIENCRIYSSRNCVLVGQCPNTDISLISSEFYGGGRGTGQEHNVYIGHVNSLTMKYCYTHDSHGGQLIKTRAKKKLYFIQSYYR